MHLFIKFIKLMELLLFVLRETLVSSLRIAWDVITPGAHRAPGIVAVPLDARSDAEITLLAHLTTLTPGTICLDVCARRHVLYVHSMFAADPEAVRAAVKNGFERRILEIMRWRGR